jgi:L-alanine-DL-glutamate epimerase-like enolase superfamily enzyme
MRISEVNVIQLSYPLEEEAYDATARWREFSLVLVKVTTSNGLIGLADIAPLNKRDTAIFEVVIKKGLEQLVIGENPLDLERIWRKMIGKGSSAYSLGNKGIVVSAASAIDICLWDIVSKYYGTPLYNLLGGKFREKVMVYPSFMGYVSNEMLDEVKRQGFKAIKFKVGFNVNKDFEEVKKVRDALNEFKVMVDGNQGYDLYQAIKFAEKVKGFDIEWFEEPINVFNIKDLSVLSSKISIPIALGENYYSLDEFAEVIINDIAAIVQPDTNHGGGVTQIRKIASIAECYDVKFAPHLHSIIGFVVGLHMLTSFPNGYIAEYPMYGKRWEFRDKFIEDCVKIENGFARLTCKEGIGVKFKELLIEKYKVK